MPDDHPYLSIVKEIEASAERVQRCIDGEGPVHTILPDVPMDQGTTPKMWDSIFGDNED